MSKTEPWLHTPAATAEIIRKYDFKFRKSFGQNFLIDSNIINKIIAAADIHSGDIVLEIGPGIGTLTQHLAYNAGKAIAVEIDERLIPVLEDTLSDYDNITVINEDVLKLDIIGSIEKICSENAGRIDSGVPKEKGSLKSASERNFDRKIKVIANLPYYVTTPVIMELLENSEYIDSITIMVQKEVAERMAAKPGTKDYGALTLAVDYYCEAEKITDVSHNCFMPRPDVTSTVIQLRVKESRQSVCDEKLMFKLIKAAFSQRRKTLLNSLKNSGEFSLTKEQWEKALDEAQIPPTVRGETLRLEEFARLAEKVK